MDISARFCPVCRKKNESEAAICVHCGASLEAFFKDSATTQGTEPHANERERTGDLVFDETLIPVDGIAFYVKGISKPVFSSTSRKFIVGRKINEIQDDLFDL